MSVASTGHDGGAIVRLTAQGRREFDRFHLRAERAREGTVDHAVDSAFETVENPHDASFPSSVCRPDHTGGGHR